MAILPASLTTANLRTLLAGPLLAQGAAGADPVRWSDVLRHDVIPVAAAFGVFVGLLVAYQRATRSTRDRPAPPTAGKGDAPERSSANVPGWGDLCRYLAGTVVGGYVFFLAIVLVFYFALGGEDRSFIRQALIEGSLLAALVVPAFLLLSWIDALRSHRGPGA